MVKAYEEIFNFYFSLSLFSLSLFVFISHETICKTYLLYFVWSKTCNLKQKSNKQKIVKHVANEDLT